MSLLRERVYLSVLSIIISVFIAYFVGNVLIPVLPLYLSSLGFTTSLIGLAVSATFARILVTVFAGYLADVIGRFRALVIGCIACAVGVALLATAGLRLIVASRFITGLFGAFIAPILWSYALALASRTGMHGRLMSMLNMVTNLSMIVAFAASGFLIATLGYHMLFLFLSALVMLIPLFVYPVCGGRASLAVKPRFRESIADALRAHRLVPIMCICCLSEWYVLNSWIMLTSLYLEELGASKELIGLILTVETVVYMALQPAIGHIIDRLGTRSTMLLSSAIGYAIVLTLVPMLKDPMLVTVALAGLAVVSAPVIFSVVSMCTPEDKRGAAMGLLFTFGYIGAAVRPLTNGFLTEVSYMHAYMHLAVPLTILTPILGVASYVYMRKRA